MFHLHDVMQWTFPLHDLMQWTVHSNGGGNLAEARWLPPSPCYIAGDILSILLAQDAIQFLHVIKAHASHSLWLAYVCIVHTSRIVSCADIRKSALHKKSRENRPGRHAPEHFHHELLHALSIMSDQCYCIIQTAFSGHAQNMHSVAQIQSCAPQGPHDGTCPLSASYL